MVTAAVRGLLCSGAALATAGAITLGPLPAPPGPDASALPGFPLPVVGVDDIALTGIGQDIYYAITPTVQYVVGGVSYLINFIPLIGGPIAAQININYFQGVQPVVEATVNYLAALVQDPLNFVASTQAYGETLYDIGYNWVSAELMFFGQQPLPPLPQSAAAGTVRGPRAAAATTAVGARPARGGTALAAANGLGDADERPTAAAGSAPIEAAAPEAGKGVLATGAGGPASSRERIRASRSEPRVAPVRTGAAPQAPGSRGTATADRAAPGQRSPARAVRGS